MPEWVYWMIAAVLMAGIELVVFTGFIFGPLALAAFVTSLVAAAGGSIQLQLAVFVVLAVAAMFALRPIAKRQMRGDPKLLSNVDALIGKEAFALEDLSHEKLGLVRFEDDNWTARPVSSIERIAANETVRVVKVAGATVVVEPLDSNDSEGVTT